MKLNGMKRRWHDKFLSVFKRVYLFTVSWVNKFSLFDFVIVNCYFSWYEDENGKIVDNKELKIVRVELENEGIVMVRWL